MLKTFAVLSSIFSLILVALPVSLLLLVPAQTPVVSESGPLAAVDVRRIKTLLKDNNPLNVRHNQRRYIELNEDDFNLLLRNGAKQVGQIAARAKLADQVVMIDASFQLPNNPFGAYVNVRTQWVAKENWVQLTELQVGKLRFPSWLTRFAFQILDVQMKQRFAEYQQLKETLNSVQMMDRKMVVAYDWRPELIKEWQARGNNFLLPQEQQKLLAVYHNHLAMFTYKARWQPYGLEKLLVHMFTLARQRSAQGFDPVEENRALFLSMGIYATGTSLARYIKQMDGKPLLHPRYTRGSLLSRQDLMQHFLVSGALTVAAGTRLADLVGMAKELDDSIDGSGFSFADLLADRSGVQLAEAAVRDRSSALKVQELMSSAQLTEMDFMASISQLPEGLGEKEFKRKYKDAASAEYQLAQQEIEKRIQACRVFKELEKV